MSLVADTVRSWIDDAAPSMGASLAFYTLFSLAPLLLVVIALAGPFLGRAEAQEALLSQLAAIVGAKATQGIEALLAAGPHEHSIAAAVTLLVGATTVFVELQADMNRIWHYKAPKGGSMMKFLRSRLLSFTLVMSIGLLLLASVVLTATLSWMARTWFPVGHTVIRTAEFGVSVLVVTGLFATIYKLLPAQRVEWRDVWVGAAVTSVLFWIGKILIAIYIAKAALAAKFGAAGAIIVVVAWVYYTAQIFFLGAEFTRQYALRRGSVEPLLEDPKA